MIRSGLRAEAEGQAMPDRNAVYCEQTRNELKQLMQDKNLSYSVVARSLGISSSSLNQWMNDCYKGNSEKIELAVKSFIEKSIQRDYKTKSSFVMTSIAEDVFDVAKLCHLDSEIGVCYGPAGLGKTFAVKEYVKRNSDVILIEADLGYTTKILFSELHQLLGFEGIGSIHQMKKDIISKLQNSGRLIIVDEAEHLPYKAIDFLWRKDLITVEYKDTGIYYKSNRLTKMFLESFNSNLYYELKEIALWVIQNFYSYSITGCWWSLSTKMCSTPPISSSW